MIFFIEKMCARDMNVFITGGLGFVGRALAKALRDNGHGITIVERNPDTKPPAPGGIHVIRADASKPGPWQKEMITHDAVVNLAVVSIFTRWTAAKKEEIINSRVLITRCVADALKRNDRRASILISASAVGYYGFHGNEELTESDPPGDDFLARVCRAWEKEAMAAANYGVRVIPTRFGVVLGRQGGALDILRRLHRWRLGARIGSGEQWFSWIHLDDLAAAIIFLLEKKGVSGPVNCTSPHPVTNRDLTRALNRAMKTFPLVPPVPGFALRILLGEFGTFLLTGQRVVPRRLLDEGFSFRFSNIQAALKDCVGR